MSLKIKIMLSGLFGRAKNNTTSKSEIKYLISTANAEEWNSKISTHVKNIHDSLVQQTLATQMQINQASTISVEGVENVSHVSIGVQQHAKMVNILAFTNELVRKTISTEFASFLSDIDAMFRRENVNTLKSVVANEKGNSMMSSLLKAIGSGEDSETTIGNSIENRENLKNLHKSEFDNIRNEFSSQLQNINFEAEIMYKSDQMNIVKVARVKNTNVLNIAVHQVSDALSECVNSNKLSGIFERVLNTSDSFKFVRATNAITNSSTDMTSTTIEKNETFGDILQGLFSGLMMPLIVVALGLLVVLAFYFF